tara:strand:+ start:29610 stop:30566 length:957 start_codon:yes stop_codon:yes gene_type:complete
MTNTLANFSNFFETTLDGAVGASDTQLDLSAAPTADGSNNINAPFYLVINPDSTTKREVVLVTASSGTNMQTVTRDVEGRHSPNPTHDDGATVRMAVVGEMFEDLHDRINDVALTGDVTGTLTNATSAVATTIAAGAVDYAMIADTVDEDDMTSNSATKLPSQQSVKAYADTKLALSGGTLTGAVNVGDQEVSAVVLKDYAETDVAISYGTDLAIDLANGNTGSVTLTGNVSGGIDFTNVPTNGTSTFTLKITQDGTGSRTLDIDEITVNGGSHVTGLTPGNAGITLTTAANSVDLVTFLFFDAGTPLINALLDFKNS